MQAFSINPRDVIGMFFFEWQRAGGSGHIEIALLGTGSEFFAQTKRCKVEIVMDGAAKKPYRFTFAWPSSSALRFERLVRRHAEKAVAHFAPEAASVPQG